MEVSSSSLPLPETAPESLSKLAQRSDTRSSLEMPVLQMIKRVIRRNVSGYLFLLPAFLIFGLFVWYPVILGFIMSFQSFAIAWRNTLEYTGYALLFGYAVPIILALLINEMRHGKGFLRLAFYLPVMMSPIVTAFLWRWIYNPDSGLLNALLNLIHLPGGLWLETPSSALPALVVITTWSNAGATMLIYLAALQAVPAQLYEAAEIDGANLWKRLWHVTLPNIRPIMLLMLILQVIATMQIFTEPFAITGGGPQNATTSVVMLIYNYAFQYDNLGEASAQAVLLFLALAVFALIYMRMTRRSMEGD